MSSDEFPSPTLIGLGWLFMAVVAGSMLDKLGASPSASVVGGLLAAPATLIAAFVLGRIAQELIRLWGGVYDAE